MKIEDFHQVLQSEYVDVGKRSLMATGVSDEHAEIQMLCEKYG